MVGHQFRNHDLTELIEESNVSESILYQQELMKHCLDNNCGTILVTKYKCRNINNNNKTNTTCSKNVKKKEQNIKTSNNCKKPIVAITLTVDVRNYLELLSIEQKSHLSTMNNSISVDIEHFLWDLAIETFSKKRFVNNKEKNELYNVFDRQLNWESKSGKSVNNSNNSININKISNLMRYGVTACIHPKLMRQGIMMYHNYMEYINFVYNYNYEYFLSCLVNEMSFNLVKSIFGKENVTILAKISHKNALNELRNEDIITKRKNGLKYFDKQVIQNEKVIKFVNTHPNYYLICWKCDYSNDDNKLPFALQYIKPKVEKYYGLNMVANKKQYCHVLLNEANVSNANVWDMSRATGDDRFPRSSISKL